jgi:hypothetical protein
MYERCFDSLPRGGPFVRVDGAGPSTLGSKPTLQLAGHTKARGAAHTHSHICLKSTPLSGANKIATEALSVPTETLARASMCGSYLRMYTDTLHAEPGGAEWAQLALLCRPTNRSTVCWMPRSTLHFALAKRQQSPKHNIHTPSRPKRHSGQGNRRVHPPYEVWLCPVAMLSHAAVFSRLRLDSAQQVLLARSPI